MTFRELRELQKVAASAHVGPGAYELPQQKMNNITIGGRHDQKLSSTPGPGFYQTD